EEAAAVGQSVAVAREVTAPFPYLGRARGPEDVGERRRGLTQYECAPGLDDAGLLTGDVSERGSDGLGMVEADVGDHRHLALGDEERGQDARRRALAVCSRQVEDGIGTVRIAHQLHQTPDSIQPLGRGPGRRVGLEVDVVVEVGEGAGQVHRSQVPRKGVASDRRLPTAWRETPASRAVANAGRAAAGQPDAKASSYAATRLSTEPEP